jgi:hypothetical protein
MLGMWMGASIDSIIIILPFKPYLSKIESDLIHHRKESIKSFQLTPELILFGQQFLSHCNFNRLST